MEISEYTIIGAADGSVTVSFDGHQETIHCAPVGDADALKSFIETYLAAYVAGKEAQVQALAPSADTLALVNKKQTVRSKSQVEDIKSKEG